jgi:hypothetical protein
MRCNKDPEISIKGPDQGPGQFKVFAKSDFAECDPGSVLFALKDDINRIELYRTAAIEHKVFHNWGEFARWLDGLQEGGIQISLKLPCLVYDAVKKQKPSMQNFIVEAVKLALKKDREA